MGNEILNRIVDWGRETPEVRALILEGSRAESNAADDLSDYDVNVFLTDSTPYTEDKAWLSSIAEIWVCIPEAVEHNGTLFPSRLVIFRDGIKVDFILYSLDVLEEYAKADPLPAGYDTGYKVLLDKDHITARMRAPSYSAFKGKQPSAEEFIRCVNAFWFEVYHVATYLRRQDLWAVKFRDWECKRFLIRMIEWHENALRNWDLRTNPLGKRMTSWVSAETWKALHNVFGRFDSQDSWRALEATTKLFRRVAGETAETLGFTYPQDLDGHISGFIERIRTESTV